MPLQLSCSKPNPRNLLTLLTLGGAILGTILGFSLRAVPRDIWWTPREVLYVGFIGEIYLRLLTMFVLPLLITTVINGIASIDLQASWQLAARASIFFLSSIYVAVWIGIAVALAIRPGVGVQVQQQERNEDGVLGVDTALDIFRNIFPTNFVEANYKHERTVLVVNESLPVYDWKIEVTKVEGVNITGLITMALAVGVAVSVSMPSGKALLGICQVTSKAMMIAIGWVIWVTPVAVISMVAAKLLQEQDLSALLERLGLYFVAVLVGLFIHALVVLPTAYFFITRKNPGKLLVHMGQALATAFGTASSNATLPVTMECLEERAGMDNRIVSFIAPIATSLNLNGTALYEAVAIVFISQIRDANLDFPQLLLISLTVTAACVGNAGVPQAGLVTMVLILGSLGLPVRDFSIIVAVDWLLDRFRTTVNVIACAYAAGVVGHLSEHQLADIGKRKYSKVAQREPVDDGEEMELNVRL